MENTPRMAFEIDQENREILIEFITESSEAIKNAELFLLQLEDELLAEKAIDQSTFKKIYNSFHSINQSASFLKLNQIKNITNQSKKLVDALDKEILKPEKKHIDILLDACDGLLLILDRLKSDFSEGKKDKHFTEIEQNLASFLINIKNVKKQKTDKKKNNTNHKPKDEFLSTLITPEIIEQFITDSNEMLDSLEQDLMVIETNPTQKDVLANAFRSIHSLKGNASCFNFNDITAVCHKVESFLDVLRTGEQVAQPNQISLILQVLDFIRQAVESLVKEKTPVIPGKTGLLELMDEVFQNSTVADSTSLQNNQDKTKKQTSKTDKNKQAPLVTEKHLNEVIRVDISKLNQLMDLVGEIVIAEAMVSHNPDLQNLVLPNFERSITNLQKNIRELQDLATSMRLIPLSGIFGKMRRLVRDISDKSDKKVEFEVNGGETEVDRSVIEHISDPLVHILRNAIDHGIEKPADRKKKNKPETGKITLQAKRVGGEIWIQINDDGKGLDRKEIISNAVEKGLISISTEELTDEQVFGFIFTPGFSTAKQITNISGRGVGMDVVARNIEKIRGRVDVQSDSDIGTKITLKIPLTTAIIDGMLMRVNKSLYAIPTLDIKESLKINPEQVIDLLDGQEIIRLRERLIPVLRLNELYNLGSTCKNIADGIVVVAENYGQEIGFLVDEIIGQQQLVIKSISNYLTEINGVSGCSILGTGEICLILDLPYLVKKAEKLEMN